MDVLLATQLGARHRNANTSRHFEPANNSPRKTLGLMA